MGGKKGAVLIVVLGVLCILALLATTFATMQATERQVARNYLDTVRAKLLAQSGIEDGLARLRGFFPFRAFDPTAGRIWKYYGGQIDETQDPILVPLEKAKNPSFAYEDDKDPTNADSTPSALKIEGQTRGFSGAMESGTYGNFGDHYVLKVSDLSGHIYVNDGLDGGPNGSVSRNLKRILNILGSIKPTVDVPGLGDKILAGRPATGYQEIKELLPVFGYDEAIFNRVREFVTVRAWVDPNVANPVPLSATTEARDSVPAAQGGRGFSYDRGSPPVYRFGKSKDAFGNALSENLDVCPHACPGLPHDSASIRIYGLDTLNPQWIEVVSRAPVNVNTAPREVLIALLSDLKGFFLTDRRRNNPSYNGGFYDTLRLTSSLSPDPGQYDEWGWDQPNEGDEYGFLAETLPIVGPGGGTVTQGIAASLIADEIVACRDRKASPNFDYSTVKWAGPFKSWNLFNTFVDNLVQIGVIQDNRPLWFDYPGNNSVEFTGNGALIASGQQGQSLQKQHAARAIADVLKANFNPNLHLNEANPDENLHLIVDKTDLIVNSTEFCFLSMGYFEIESVGRVVRPETGADAMAAGVNNQLVSQGKITAIVKLYDLYRETNQKQFGAGNLGGNASTDTNNGKTVEVGPEPEDGKGFDDKEWGGYVALPTVGGDSHINPNGPHLGDAMHVHFMRDYDAHYHLFDRKEVASRALPDEAVMNFPDLPGLPSGPCDPTDGDFRVARSFRLKPGATAPSPVKVSAPSDLRIDGGYSERHAAPAYYTSSSKGKIWNFSQDDAPRGMVSFWMKPSFDPERTGKIRAAWDLSRYHDCPWGLSLFPLVLYFLPAHATSSSMMDSGSPHYLQPEYGDAVNGSIGQYHPSSLAFGTVQRHPAHDDLTNGFVNITLPLNHRGHADNAAKPSVLRGHRWMNVAISWNVVPGGWEPCSTLFINGSPDFAPWRFNTMNPGWSDVQNKFDLFEAHEGGEFNHIRLGAPSQFAASAGLPCNANYTSDFTFDEFYVWKTKESPGATEARTLWLRGRYYKPINGTAGQEGVFTSQPFLLGSSQPRTLAPASNVSPPPGTPPVPSGPTMTNPSSGRRILGLSWTWYGETVDADGNPVLYDYQNSSPTAPPPPDVKPKIEFSIKDGSLSYPAIGDDGFAAVTANNGISPVLQQPDQVRYAAQFRLQQADLNTILLATPVLDDVTVFWDDGETHFLSYIYDNRSF